jgi:hypothetical protein
MLTAIMQRKMKLKNLLQLFCAKKIRAVTVFFSGRTKIETKFEERNLKGEMNYQNEFELKWKRKTHENVETRKVIPTHGNTTL